MGREEGKIATGRFRSNMAAREESSLSRDVNNALNEGKLACQHRSCTVNDIFIATSEYLAAIFVSSLAIIILYKTDGIFNNMVWSPGFPFGCSTRLFKQASCRGSKGHPGIHLSPQCREGRNSSNNAVLY